MNNEILENIANLAFEDFLEVLESNPHLCEKQVMPQTASEIVEFLIANPVPREVYEEISNLNRANLKPIKILENATSEELCIDKLLCSNFNLDMADIPQSKLNGAPEIMVVTNKVKDVLATLRANPISNINNMAKPK